MIWRVLLIFPILVFVLIRQIYANLLGVSRDMLTALLLASLSCLGIVAFLDRLRERRRDLLVIDLITISQFFLTALAILGYAFMARIDTVQVVASLYYYCLAPFLIYGGFLLFRFPRSTRKAALVAAGLAYLMTFWVAVYEVLGIDFWLFQYERWELFKNYTGITRAAGLYGTQIDYGCLSFIAFCVAYYMGVWRPHWFAKTAVAAAGLGALASLSRVWIAAIVLVLVADIALRQTNKQRVRATLAVVVIGAALYPVADGLGLTGMIVADDPYTQESNDSRLTILPKMSQWVLHDYLVVGTGPGTQTGPDAKGAKIVTDFLWLAFLVDFGAIVGSVLVVLRIVLLAYLVVRSCRSRGDPSLRWITTTLCVSFFLASFVDGAYVHQVTIALFYLIAGFFLYCDRPGQPATDLQCA